MTLVLERDGEEQTTADVASATVPIGTTRFTYRSRELLAIGDQLECHFTVCLCVLGGGGLKMFSCV